jgi:hypothetical protein
VGSVGLFAVCPSEPRSTPPGAGFGCGGPVPRAVAPGLTRTPPRAPWLSAAAGPYVVTNRRSIHWPSSEALWTGAVTSRVESLIADARRPWRAAACSPSANGALYQQSYARKPGRFCRSSAGQGRAVRSVRVLATRCNAVRQGAAQNKVCPRRGIPTAGPPGVPVPSLILREHRQREVGFSLVRARSAPGCVQHVSSASAVAHARVTVGVGGQRLGNHHHRRRATRAPLLRRGTRAPVRRRGHPICAAVFVVLFFAVAFLLDRRLSSGRLASKGAEHEH